MVYPIGTTSCPWTQSTTIRLRETRSLFFGVLLATALYWNGRSFFLTDLQTGLVWYAVAMLVTTLALLFLHSNPNVTLIHSRSHRTMQTVFTHVHTWLRKPQVRKGVLIVCIVVMLIGATGYWWQPIATHDMADPLHTNRQDRTTQGLDMGNTIQDQPDAHALAVVPVNYPVKASLYAVGIVPTEDRVFPNDRHRKIIGSSE